MTKQSIFVVGSLHYDIVLKAPHLPARDETVMGNNVKYVCGGKGGNQAIAAAQHGATVCFAGAVGEDFFADALLDNLHRADVETSQVMRSQNTASGMSVAIVEPSGEYGAVVASGVNQAIEASVVKLPNDTALVILQNEIPDRVNIAVARQAREIGAKTILNAAPMRTMPDALLGLIDMLIVNRVEAEALFERSIRSHEDAIIALDKSTLACPEIIVTLGADGLVFIANKQAPKHISARTVRSISSHGAGDTFVGALCAQMVSNDDLDTALNYASAAAALHVSTPVERRGQVNQSSVVALISDSV